MKKESEGKFSRKHENLVATLRGGRTKNPRTRLRRTEGVGTLMDRLLEKHRLLAPRIESQLMPQWSYVVGEHNAHRCAPVRIENGALRVACAHPVMVREMMFCKKMILKRLQSVCPTIREVRFVAG